MEAAWFAPVSLYKDFTAKYFTTTCGEKIVTIFVDSERIDRERKRERDIYMYIPVIEQ